MRVALIFSVAALFARGAQSCSFDVASIKATYLGKPYLNASNTSYTVEEVEESFYGLGTYGKPRWVKNTATSFKCVDSRGDENQDGLASLAGTPGGDFSELLAGIVSFHRVKNTTVTQQSVNKIFRQFVTKVASPKRPFYFHQGDSKIIHAFEEVEHLIKEHNMEHNDSEMPEGLPIAFPETKPAGMLGEIWIKALTEYPDAQGCGHIRLTMSNPTDYGLVGAEANATSWLLKSFYNFWWSSKEGSYQRAVTVFPILPGDLKGRSMTIINNTGPECLDSTPTVIPHHAASTQFVYAAQAVTDFRRLVLVPFFKAYDKTIDASALFDTLQDLQGTQLGAVLRLLSPVNALNINRVDITTTTEAPKASRKLHVHGHVHKSH